MALDQSFEPFRLFKSMFSFLFMLRLTKINLKITSLTAALAAF
jgi:hypothetical protein